jgi:hypothetical protein
MAVRFFFAATLCVPFAVLTLLPTPVFARVATSTRSLDTKPIASIVALPADGSCKGGGGGGGVAAAALEAVGTVVATVAAVAAVLEAVAPEPVALAVPVLAVVALGQRALAALEAAPQVEARPPVRAQEVPAPAREAPRARAPQPTPPCRAPASWPHRRPILMAIPRLWAPAALVRAPEVAPGQQALPASMAANRDSREQPASVLPAGRRSMSSGQFISMRRCTRAPLIA